MINWSDLKIANDNRGEITDKDAEFRSAEKFG
jgi:hypothetical protein